MRREHLISTQFLRKVEFSSTNILQFAVMKKILFIRYLENESDKRLL